ncbi:MAG: hypothetical protein J2P23_00250 [Microlunatus sp.]|nr:hypothetical protein [Microlunatus sp.]
MHDHSLTSVGEVTGRVTNLESAHPTTPVVARCGQGDFGRVGADDVIGHTVRKVTAGSCLRFPRKLMRV